MKIALILTALIMLASYLFTKNKDKKSHAEKDIAFGPFTVRVTAVIGENYVTNDGRAAYENLGYSILHEGKPIEFPKDMQTDKRQPFMWAVYALPGAPVPTLVAGSEKLFLVYLKDGAPAVEQILAGGSLQILDSENGLPGPWTKISCKYQSQVLEMDTLANGRYLLIGEHAVLDAQTREIRYFNAKDETIENYTPPTPHGTLPHGALAFSPDRRSIVFPGIFQNWNTPDDQLPDTEHALLVYHIEKDSSYALIFDDNDLRLVNGKDMTPEWFQKFFEWKKTPDGERLQRQKLEKPANWAGSLSKEFYYTLYPVNAGIMPAFLDFLEKQMGWTKANIVEDKFHEYTGRRLTFASGEQKFDVCLKEDEQKLQFSRNLYADDSPEYQAMVKKIADAFEAELASGKHQEHFGRIVSETKKIRSL